jgi:adenosylcobyric acid synthase
MKGLIASTMSDSGKSLIVAGLSRIFRLKPVKFQNMSLNSFPTHDYGEIAFIQAFQAIGSGYNLSRDLNPVLLKPSGEGKVEVILFGETLDIISYSEYYSQLDNIWKVVLEGLTNRDQIIVEGAGSIGEPNFVNVDISSIKPATQLKLPIILVVDIDRGGAFASILGSYNIVPSQVRDLMKGFIINKFRGDHKLLEPAIKWIEERTRLKYLGSLPYYEFDPIMAEDSMNIRTIGNGEIQIGVIAYPYMSNFNEFSVFENSNATVYFIPKPSQIKKMDLIILPGSKNVLKSLKWLYDMGFTELLKSKPVLGICGGFQVMSKKIIDPYGIEFGYPTEIQGLGIFDTVTRYNLSKVVSISEGQSEFGKIRGYEIRRGEIIYKDERPILTITKRGYKETEVFDGAIKGNKIGFSIHGALYSEFGYKILEDFGIKIKYNSLEYHITEKVKVIENEIRKHLFIDEISKILDA